MPFHIVAITIRNDSTLGRIIIIIIQSTLFIQSDSHPKSSSDPDNDVTLKQYLETEQTTQEAIDKVAEQLDIAHLLPLSFVKLSNGQTRRARIARALLRHPSMLILDEPLSKSIWMMSM